jgi:hypothetical protein
MFGSDFLHFLCAQADTASLWTQAVLSIITAIHEAKAGGHASKASQVLDLELHVLMLDFSLAIKRQLEALPDAMRVALPVFNNVAIKLNEAESMRKLADASRVEKRKDLTGTIALSTLLLKDGMLLRWLKAMHLLDSDLVCRDLVLLVYNMLTLEPAGKDQDSVDQELVFQVWFSGWAGEKTDSTPSLHA